MRVVFLRQGGLCCCGCGRPIAEGPIGFHHAFCKQRWPELIDVADNVFGVAAICHANHEAASRRLPRRSVAVAIKLIADGRMRSYFKRTYPA